MVPPDSRRIPRVPRYSGAIPTTTEPFSHTGLSPSMADLSRVVLLRVRSWRGVRSLLRYSPTTPDRQRLRALTPIRFRLFPFRSPLLRESRLISFPPATKMFQFAGLASRQSRDDSPSGCRVSPFGNPRIKGCLAPPRGLSQLTTPFIASGSQGIPRVPLMTSLAIKSALLLRPDQSVKEP